MSLFLLFVSFFFALYGAWVFFSGYTGGQAPNKDVAFAMSGIAYALIPYLVSKTLSEMVAIRQRHMQLEQSAQFNYMIAEQMEIAQEAARQQVAAMEQAQQAAAEAQQAADAKAKADAKSAPKAPPMRSKKAIAKPKIQQSANQKKPAGKAPKNDSSS